MANSYEVIEDFRTVGDWTVLGNDTTTLATSARRLTSSASISFAKVDGAANTIFGAVYKTRTPGEDRSLARYTPQDRIGLTFWIGAITNVAYAFVRLGSGASNYTEWRFLDSNMTASSWNTMTVNIGNCYDDGTNGYAVFDSNTAEPTYMCVGVAFDNEANALAGIIMDSVFLSKNERTVS